ncbi:hypothetical protein EZV62_006750 [Acer yangbiense]|uniref:Protein kinase domain-containing protein n=1 Tax=Acer yangbiense TaxID=1000413 RepID=A0A5C7I8F8_9ROSI|nr:hypothetical protein EZV62_006750 [Acer yangbiense]
MEIANTFVYLHVGFPRPIVYSWMSSSNFLLDEHCVPKLLDFSHAECIPEGETQIKDAPVRGTLGYVAPEHISMAVLDEKCDVYGFGSLLLELLTGHRKNDFFHNCAAKLIEDSSVTEDDNWISNIVKKIIGFVDPIIVGDGLFPETLQQMEVFAKLAVKCQSDSGEDRPTMIDVAKQLRQLHLSA